MIYLSLYYQENITKSGVLWNEIKKIQLASILLILIFYVDGNFILVDSFKARSAYEIDTFHYSRWSGVFGFPGDYANFLSLGLIVCISRILEKKNNWSDWLLTISMLVCLKFTESRNGFFLLAYSLIVIFIVKPRLDILAIVFFVGGLGGVIFAFSGSDYLARVLLLENFIENQSRFYEWEVFLVEKFGFEFPFSITQYESLSEFPFIESEFIKQYDLIGPIFLFAYVMVIFTSIKMLICARKKSEYSNILLISGTFLFCNTTFTLLFNAGLSRPKIGILYFYCLLSGLTALIKYSRREQVRFQLTGSHSY